MCLSILGTWDGPSWTPLCNLRAVLVSIQSLMNETPLQNEPGLQARPRECHEYNVIIQYQSLEATCDTYQGLHVTLPDRIGPYLKRAVLAQVFGKNK